MMVLLHVCPLILSDGVVFVYCFLWLVPFFLKMTTFKKYNIMENSYKYRDMNLSFLILYPSKYTNSHTHVIENKSIGIESTTDVASLPSFPGKFKTLSLFKIWV